MPVPTFATLACERQAIMAQGAGWSPGPRGWRRSCGNVASRPGGLCALTKAGSARVAVNKSKPLERIAPHDNRLGPTRPLGALARRAAPPKCLRPRGAAGPARPLVRQHPAPAPAPRPPPGTLSGPVCGKSVGLDRGKGAADGNTVRQASPLSPITDVPDTRGSPMFPVQEGWQRWLRRGAGAGRHRPGRSRKCGPPDRPRQH